MSYFKYSLVFSATILICSLLAIVGCTQKKGPPPSPRRIIRWVIPREFNLRQNLSLNAAPSPANLLMEGLTAIDFSAGLPKAIPALAESWEQKDSKRWIFRLRNLTWSDGTPLKSQHFISAWQKLSRTNSQLFQHLFGHVKSSRTKITGFQAPDDHSIDIRLDSPDPALPLKLSHPGSWPVASDSVSCCLGPFLPDGKQRLARNPFYRERHTIEGIEIRTVPNLSERFELFHNGEADLVELLAEENPGVLSRVTNLRIEPWPATYLLAFAGMRHTPVTREAYAALARNIDRDETQQLMGRSLITASQLLPILPQQQEKNSEGSGIAESARQTLGALGLPIGRRGLEDDTTRRQLQRLRLLYDDGKLSDDIAENLRAQWQRQWGFSPASESSARASLRIIRFPWHPWQADHGLRELLSDTAIDPGTKEPPETGVEKRNPTNWDRELRAERYLVPLFIESKRALVNPRIASLPWHPIEGWKWHQASLR